MVIGMSGQYGNRRVSLIGSDLARTAVSFHVQYQHAKFGVFEPLNRASALDSLLFHCCKSINLLFYRVLLSEKEGLGLNLSKKTNNQDCLLVENKQVRLYLNLCGGMPTKA